MDSNGSLQHGYGLDLRTHGKLCGKLAQNGGLCERPCGDHQSDEHLSDELGRIHGAQCRRMELRDEPLGVLRSGHSRNGFLGCRRGALRTRRGLGTLTQLSGADTQSSHGRSVCTLALNGGSLRVCARCHDAE